MIKKEGEMAEEQRRMKMNNERQSTKIENLYTAAKRAFEQQKLIYLI